MGPASVGARVLPGVPAVRLAILRQGGLKGRFLAPKCYLTRVTQGLQMREKEKNCPKAMRVNPR